MREMKFLAAWVALVSASFVHFYGAIPTKEVVSRRCHQCNATSDSQCVSPGSGGLVMSALCPIDTPYCATTASSPYFVSALTCSAAAARPCSLTYSAAQMYTMSCACTSHLCNAPFTPDLQHELINFSLNSVPHSNDADNLEAFWNTSRYANAIDDSDNIYELITTAMKETIIFPTKTLGVLPMRTAAGGMEVRELRVEESKKENDDEDDDDEEKAEGSGAEEKEEEPDTDRAPTPTSLTTHLLGLTMTLFLYAAVQ